MQKRVALVNCTETSEYAERLRSALIARHVSVAHLSAPSNTSDQWGSELTSWFENLLPPKTQHALLINSSNTSSYLNEHNSIRKFLANSQIIKSNYILPVNLIDDGFVQPYFSAGIGSVDGRMGPDEVAERYISNFGNDNRSQRAIRRSRNIREILSYYRGGAKIDHITGFVKNPSSNIGYEIFKWTDSVDDSLAQCYLYLHKYVSLERTIEHFLINHYKKIQGHSLLVIVHRDREAADFDSRREYVGKFLPASAKVIYFDDLTGKHCSGGTLNQKSSNGALTCGVPIESEMLDGLKRPHDALKELRAWLDRPNRPFALVQGSGGVGKTTLMKHFVDQTAEDATRIALFLEATTVSSLMADPGSESETTAVFRIFRNQYQLEMPEWLFFENIREGRIILIIDGIDEIIGRIREDYPIDDFFRQIGSDEEALDNAKILFTCRNYILGQSSIDLNCDIYELQPFDVERAQRFFGRSFPDDPAKAKRALEQCDAFMSTSEAMDVERRYLPYLLVVARDFVNRGPFSPSERNTDFSSAILNSSSLQDLCIFRVCTREKEIKNLTTLDVDQQVSLMCRFVVDYQGCVEYSTFDRFVTSFLRNTGHHCSADAIFAHPFIEVNNNIVSLRFDFLRNYFRGVYISSFLNGQEEIRPEAIRECLPYIRWGSELMNEIALRLPDDPRKDDDLIIRLINLKENIFAHTTEFSGFNYLERARIVSAMFLCVVWRGMKLTGQNGSGIASELMDLVFAEKSSGRTMIKHFCICDVNGDDRSKLIFDLRDRSLIACVFDNYEAFWECRFNEGTHVGRSWLKELALKAGFQTECRRHFIEVASCDCDDTAKRVVQSKEGEIKSKRVKMLNELRIIFRRIRQHGSFTTGKNISTVKSNFMLGNLSFADFLDAGIEMKVLETIKDGAKVRIMQGMAESVELFVDQGILPIGIESLADAIEKKK